MMHYKTAINIDQATDRVFMVMTQLDNIQDLMDEVERSWKVTDGPAGLGTVMIERMRFGPMRADISWQITEFEVNRLCTFEGDSTFGKTQVSYIFEGARDGTRVTAEVNAQLRGVFRLVQPVIRFLHMRNRNRYLQEIKDIME